MDHSRCNVIFLDKRARAIQTYKKDDIEDSDSRYGALKETLEQEEAVIQESIRAILETFNEVYVCPDGAACLRKLSQMEDPFHPVPTMVLLDIPFEDDRWSHPDNRAPSPSTPLKSNPVEKDEPYDIYGMHLLHHICASIRERTISRLTMPIAVAGGSEAVHSALQEEPSLHALSHAATSESVRMIRYLDVGAVDVLTSPITADRVQGLPVHAYRIYKDAAREEGSSLLTKRNRKLSWIGVDEERPFAYLREAMVSGLLEGICTPESVNDTFEPSDLKVEADRKRLIEHAVGQWSFSAHDYTSDELVYAAITILEHALQLPDLEPYRLSTDDLTILIMASRKAYNDFVLYHNFRHVVDVLQAIFYFLLQIGLLPPYNVLGIQNPTPANAIAAILKPFDALTLLIAALGHDVGHPGVNNAFLVALNAPLAQLYNDRSVLEAFHCAAYSQILRRYWPAAFSSVAMRRLMINSILATDMSLHFKYMQEMGGLQEKIAAAQSTADGWVPKVTDEHRDLVCGLLIKCADISNVARKYACAAQWARVLTDEFFNQGAMEKELNMPTCLFGGPPDPNDVLKLGESQLGFMNIFARPLFEGMTTILPEMRFALVEMSANKSIWQERIEAEHSRKMSFARGPISPMGRSFASPSDSDHGDRDRRPSHLPNDPFAAASKQTEADKDRSKGQPSIALPPTDAPEIAPDEIPRNLSITSEPPRGRSLGSAIPNTVCENPIVNKLGVEGSEQRRHSSVYSHKEDEEPPGTRPTTAEKRMSRAIFFASPASDAAQNILNLSHSQPPSPGKSALSNLSHSQGFEHSLLSSRSQATSNATADIGGPASPSTRASSVEDDAKPTADLPQPPPVPTYLHANKSEDFAFLNKDPHHFTTTTRKMQAMSVYGPDVLAMAAASPGKHSTTSHIIAGDSDDVLGDGVRDLRMSRSQSKLRGLRFWRKKPKGELDVDQTP